MREFEIGFSESKIVKSIASFVFDFNKEFVKVVRTKIILDQEWTLKGQVCQERIHLSNIDDIKFIKICMDGFILGSRNRWRKRRKIKEV